MSVGTALYTLLIKPLELLFEVIYSVANSVIVNPGLSIIALSLAMNILVLPLYMRADALQMEEQERENRLKDMTAHIRKTFKGDERFMMLQAYYRENDYKPIYALRGSFSLLLEIPFFIAAYHFLSHLELIKGVSFGPIKDLGLQDSLIHIADHGINLLPILMTAINIISSLIYSKDSPVKTKVQLCVVAIVFLVFLYRSPSGLVFYWTLNNLFSLIKNVFYKLKNPKKIVCFISSYVGCFLAGAVLSRGVYSLRQKAILIVFCVMLQIPIVVYGLSMKRRDGKSKFRIIENVNKVFVLSVVFMALLVGLLISSQVISSSTAEFVSIANMYNPGIHVLYSFIIAVGTFVVWVGIFYYLSDKKGKTIFSEIVAIVAVVASVDYMFFGTKLGNLSPKLQFDNTPSYSIKQMVINLTVILAIAMIVHLIYTRNSKIIISVIMAGIIAVAFMSAKNIRKINTEYDKTYASIEQSSNLPTYKFSKNGKNVVILMMDRMLGDYVPYIMADRPELFEEWDGFTYYKNCTSFATSTNVGLPPIFGGYEYTPVEVNKRDDQLLVDKHNEALKVMPVLFDENGYNVTVCDPTYANYGWIPDLSIYDDYPNIKSYITMGNVNSSVLGVGDIKGLLNRNLFCYSVFKISPVFAQTSLYDNGNYYMTDREKEKENVDATVQVRTSLYQSEGIDVEFMNCYNVLDNMIGMTRIEDDSSDNFLMMCNDITHHPCMLQEPDYTPEYYIDNSDYYENGNSKTDSEGNTLNLQDENSILHYHVNMSAFLKLGEWFDYLKEQGVYDNTKIIIVSDHGWAVNVGSDIMSYENNKGEMKTYDTGALKCILMMKDFNSSGFVTDEELMTNADVPTLATKDLIDNPVNPFTGNEINSSYKDEGPLEVIQTYEWQVDSDNGYVHVPGAWFSVYDDVNDMSNWKYLGNY